jgi:hypothetical protein
VPGRAACLVRGDEACASDRRRGAASLPRVEALGSTRGSVCSWRQRREALEYAGGSLHGKDSIEASNTRSRRPPSISVSPGAMSQPPTHPRAATLGSSAAATGSARRRRPERPGGRPRVPQPYPRTPPARAPRAKTALQERRCHAAPEPLLVSSMKRKLRRALQAASAWQAGLPPPVWRVPAPARGGGRARSARVTQAWLRGAS